MAASALALVDEPQALRAALTPVRQRLQGLIAK